MLCFFRSTHLDLRMIRKALVISHALDCSFHLSLCVCGKLKTTGGNRREVWEWNRSLLRRQTRFLLCLVSGRVWLCERQEHDSVSNPPFLRPLEHPSLWLPGEQQLHHVHQRVFGWLSQQLCDENKSKNKEKNNGENVKPGHKGSGAGLCLVRIRRRLRTLNWWRLLHAFKRFML